MISRITNAVLGKNRPDYPSTVLSVSDSTMTYILHIVPEDNSFESSSYSHLSRTKLHYGHTKEQSREQVGSITLYHDNEGEPPLQFLEDVRGRATKILDNDTKRLRLNTVTTTETVDDLGESIKAVTEALRSAVADSLEERASRSASSGQAETYPIFLVHIHRSRAGKVITDAELTSFPR